MTLLDTHAWMWWVTGDPRLSKRARTATERAAGDADVAISAISIWEVAKKVEKGHFELDRPLNDWLDAALAIEGLQVLELTRKVLLESCGLPRPFHGDPADQIIVATARTRAATLVTADTRIRGYGHVQTVW